MVQRRLDLSASFRARAEEVFAAELEGVTIDEDALGACIRTLATLVGEVIADKVSILARKLDVIACSLWLFIALADPLMEGTELCPDWPCIVLS